MTIGRPCPFAQLHLAERLTGRNHGHSRPELGSKKAPDKSGRRLGLEGLSGWLDDQVALEDSRHAVRLSFDTIGEGPKTMRLFSAATVVAVILALCPLSVRAQTITTPEQAFGHAVGDDYQLINYQQFERYLHTLAGQSDRMKLLEIGRSTEGRTLRRPQARM